MTDTADRAVRRQRVRTPYGARVLGRADQSPRAQRAQRVRVQLLLTGPARS